MSSAQLAAQLHCAAGVPAEDDVWRLDLLSDFCRWCLDLHQCEFCNHWFAPSELDYVDEDLEEEHHFGRWCSLQCANDHYEEIRIARLEGEREFQIYGDDFDSWYR